ncbi:NADH pyrophosphatase zinc ribbon domain-containing protein [Ornithinimicrobium sp. INDO-MA30-4]|uniref:NADH pyrophosphatase zinc ribbon domain-containing protein n=1 Tax=Ornithinimicrobium sp. INDO-MA30-4 TaxID=2908651 RepID=UPI001F205A6F|nr:NADH pyrophosphatase zinc ribbon domain-containing protein [Ornithinimicrobium sp. INDO-MA30-4]UJH71534.1 hypothetical protein L0A91_07670 [Ornithinimicrobium sp. INDO-MA30-4]
MAFLREAGVDLGDIDAGVFTTGVALANWHERHTCCPRCGSETTVAEGGWVRACEVDGSEHHPAPSLPSSWRSPMMKIGCC